MPQRLCVIDLPGLSKKLLGEIPGNSSLGKWLATQKIAGLTPSFPALTCSVQATLTTGTSPAQHGIIANGMANYRSAEDQKLVDSSSFGEYRRDVAFWEQSNQLLESPRFWAKWPTAMLFFQNAMPGFVAPQRPAAQWVVTPKPEHAPDGKITSLLWSNPSTLNGVFAELGPFPLMNYWGPMAGIAASRWIAAAAALVWQKEAPTLQFTYVPHLDYDLQRFGPDSSQAHQAVRDVAGALDPLVDAVLNSGGRLVVLSEYAISAVNGAGYPNRALAQAGLLKTRSTPDGNLVDYENSAAFAMVDHQIAHIYVRERIDEVRQVLSAMPEVGEVLEHSALNHRRAGDLILLARPDRWFAYPWWMDEPTVFAGAVDIHRKPGYDPLELFWDRSANRVSFDASLLRGSHGLVQPNEAVIAGYDADLHAHEVAGVLASMLS